MGNWFGNLDLAYKYTVVFLSLLALTFVAGLVKVFFDRRKLKKLVAQQKDEENPASQEQVALNRREKDEGDLFGIRAIEAGYFAGIPQSRPTSRASSPAPGPMMSSSTLVGSFSSPKLQSHSVSSSVTTLPLAHVKDRNRDSETLPTPPRRTSPTTSKLLPSEAELTGRHNFNAAVNMNLEVPPSPVATSDDDESIRYKSEQSSPVPPQMPFQNDLQVSVQSANAHKSHIGSLNMLSPLHSPDTSGPKSPRHRPRSYVPTMPGQANGEDHASPYPAHHEPQQPHKTEPEQSPAPILLLPQTYSPVHQRDTSNASSTYSEHRTSTIEPRQKRMSILPTASRKSNANLAPEAANDPRFSEFYDAYFRNSRLNFGLKFDTPDQQATIMEVPSPEPSPKGDKPGMAM